MLQYRLYDGQPLPAGLQGFMKAGANIGSVIGQFGFGASLSLLIVMHTLTSHSSARFCCRLLWPKSRL